MRFALPVAAIASIVSVLTLYEPARAQTPFEAEVHELHLLCDKGDRRACVKFGMLIEQHRDMHAAWRNSHPEWFWWDH